MPVPIAYALVAFAQISITLHPLYALICFPIMYGIFHLFNRHMWHSQQRSWPREGCTKIPTTHRTMGVYDPIFIQLSFFVQDFYSRQVHILMLY